MTMTAMTYVLTPNLLQLTRNQLDLSLSQLAKETGLSKSTIIRAEQGLLVSIPPALIKRLNLDFELLESNYRRFQLDQRYYVGGRGGGVAFFEDDCALSSLENYIEFTERNIHPLVYLLDSRSVLDFCQAFCLPPNLINRWVSRSTTVRTVPNIVRSSLEEAGYTPTEITFLKTAYRKHLNYLLKKKVKI